MKILLVTLMLALLVGCGKKDTMTETLVVREESLEELTAPQRLETTEPTDETAETAETVEEEDIVLDEAAAFAEDEDYASAIVLLQDAMDENKKPEYERVFAEYCADYKEQTVLRAQEQAEAGDYLGAVRTINNATALIGPDEELTAMSQSYAQAHVDAERADREAAETIKDAAPEELEQTEPEKPAVTEEPEQTESEELTATEALQGPEPTVPEEVPESTDGQQSPFYGIWCCATTDANEAVQFAAEMQELGFDGQVFVTTDWSNLNQTASWYVVTAGVYPSQADADGMLSTVRTVYPDAYVKYSGTRQG